MTSIPADELVQMLNELGDAQDALLSVMHAKREAMTRSDTEQMQELAGAEAEVVERLQSCRQHRETLIAQARQDGLEISTLRELAGHIDSDDSAALEKQLDQASLRTRSLQHETLTNWVIAQRTVLHVAQMLEMIASGGRMQPTYGKGSSDFRRGNLMDQDA